MAPPATQDLDARFAVFLNPIRDLTKNWEVDIAKYLEEYLVELAEIQITFDDGVTMMNFAEAAMLIQGSATVYSKKVEFLWQMVLQMLDLLSSKRTLEKGGGNEAKENDGGKTSKHDTSLKFGKINDILDGKNIDMKGEEELEEQQRREEFKFLPAMPMHLVEKEGEKSQMRIPIYLKNGETFGNKDDFRINRSYLTPSAILCLDLPPEILKQQNINGLDEFSESGNDSCVGFLHYNPIENMQLQPVGIETPMVEPVEPPNERDFGEDDLMDMGACDDDPPPFDIEPLEKTVDHIECPVTTSVVKEIVPEVVETINGRYGLRKRGVKENVVKIKLTDPLKPLDPHVETPAKRPIRAGRIRKPLPCFCHKQVVKQRRSRKSKVLQESSEKSNGDISSVESFITKDIANLITNNNNTISRNKDLQIDTRLIGEFTKEEAKKAELLKKKRVKEIMAEKGDFTEEEAKDRLLEETQLNVQTNERMADEIADDEVPDIDFDNIDEPDLDLPDPHDDPFTMADAIEDENLASQKYLNDTLLYEPASDYEALVQKWVSDYITSAQEHIASSELTRRVNRWKKTIMPKLLEEEERKCFDIHSYGSHILSHFENGGKEEVLFEEIVRNQHPGEVSRIFLSCLMLANTYNVEINQTREGDLEMDCLQLKLLSTVRHHQELEEYAAPSQSNKSPSNRKQKVNKRKKNGSREEEEPTLNSGESLNQILTDIPQVNCVAEFPKFKKPKTKVKR